MSTFSGGIGREEEDGAGWDGLAPTRAEREEERRQQEVATRLRVLTAERDHARAQYDAAVHLLTAIHSLLYPAPVKTPDGKTLVFRPTILDAHAVLQELSDRIRALPDELATLKTPNV